MGRKFKKEFGILVLLVVLCVIVALMNPRFISTVNLQNTARLIGMFGIFSLGLALIIITGGIDLSVGSMVALLGVLLSMALVDGHWSPPLALGAVLLLGTALGGVHAFLITKVKLQPFIVTLCGLLLYRGVAQFVSKDETKGFGNAKGFEGLKEFVTGSPLGIPMSFWMLMIAAAIVGVILHKSVYGRYLFAVGRNDEAARFSGVNTPRVTAFAYIAAGFLTSVSAVLFAFYTNSVSPSSHGNFYELYGIAAAVLGGCSLRGGEGSIFGVLLGAALLQVLQNLVNLLGIPSSLNFAVMGAVILIGVIADLLLRRERVARTPS